MAIVVATAKEEILSS